MSTSGTYDFSPNLGELVLYAFRLCGIDRTAVTQGHMQDAKMAVNLLLADWLNKGVNLWQVDLITIPMLQGVATYNIDPSVFVLLDGYVTVTQNGVSTDRPILPVGRSEYASYPNKALQGFPSIYWMDRTLSPTVTLWPVPNGQQNSASFYVLRQAQDAGYSGGEQPAVPYAWLKALAFGLAEGLAPIYALDRHAAISNTAAAAYTAAASANVETALQYITPMVGGYYRT